jgi:hypothetical protein
MSDVQLFNFHLAFGFRHLNFQKMPRHPFGQRGRWFLALNLIIGSFFSDYNIMRM